MQGPSKYYISTIRVGTKSAISWHQVGTKLALSWHQVGTNSGLGCDQVTLQVPRKLSEKILFKNLRQLWHKKFNEIVSSLSQVMFLKVSPLGGDFPKDLLEEVALYG